MRKMKMGLDNFNFFNNNKKLNFIIILLLTSFLWAKPEIKEVKSGSLDIFQDGDITKVTQHTDRAVAHWNNFSIKKEQELHFIQPSDSSSILNKVIGANPSYIDGAIRANGRVFLINEKGIIIGPEGSIKTAFFLASTMNIEDSNFLFDGNDDNNKFYFHGDSNAIIENKGKIETIAGDVLLFAREVINSGSICTKGKVGIYAGAKELFLSMDGDVTIKLEREGMVEQNGDIKAAEIEIEAAGGSPYPLAINHSGNSFIDKIEKKDGRIYLLSKKGNVNISGKLKSSDIKNSSSINIDILGKEVEIDATALIDTSNKLSGGDINIGIEDGKVLSDIVDIKKGAKISADCIENGNGGNIIIWSENLTRALGDISARGGPIGGDGGKIELSSHEHIVFDKKIDTSSTLGKAGTVIIDPSDIIIVNKSPSNPLLTSTYNPHKGEVNPCEVYIEDLIELLKTNNVLITTSNGVKGKGDVAFENVDFISPNSTYSLDIIADRDIFISSSVIQWNSLGRLIFHAGRQFVFSNGRFLNNVGEIEIYANQGGVPWLEPFNGIEFDNFTDSQLSEIKLVGRGSPAGGHGVYFTGEGDIRVLNPGIIDISGESDLSDGVRFDNIGNRSTFWCFSNDSPQLSITGGAPSDAYGINILSNGSNFIDFGGHPESSLKFKAERVNLEGDIFGYIGLQLEPFYSDEMYILGDQKNENGIFSNDFLSQLSTKSIILSSITFGGDDIGGELNLTNYDFSVFDADIIFKANDIIVLDEIFAKEKNITFEIGKTGPGYISLDPKNISRGGAVITGDKYFDQAVFLSNYNNDITLNGGSGGCSIQRPNLSSNWVIEGDKKGFVDSISFENITKIYGEIESDVISSKNDNQLWTLLKEGEGAISNIYFEDIKNVVTQGNAAQILFGEKATNFNVSLYSDNVIIKGANAANIWDISDENTIYLNGNTIAKDSKNTINIVGGNKDDTIYGPDKGGNWVIDESKGGSFENIRFSNIENIFCGDGNDTIYIDEKASDINLDGGAGDNILVNADNPIWVVADEDKIIDDVTLEEVKEISDNLLEEIYDEDILSRGDDIIELEGNIIAGDYFSDEDKTFITFKDNEKTNSISIKNFKAIVGFASIFYLSDNISRYNTYVSTRQMLGMKPENFSYSMFLPWYDFIMSDLFPEFSIYTYPEKKR